MFICIRTRISWPKYRVLVVILELVIKTSLIIYECR